MLNLDFFNQPALKLAPLLLGMFLCRNADGNILRYRITETEAYCGVADTACHAHRGRTPRNSVMYGPGGRAYIYLCYGIHNLLNVVAAEIDRPEAVLIRGVEGFSGPGRLTKAMAITQELNGVDLIHSDSLRLETDGVQLPYTSTPRVGINYASEEDRAQLWRFIVEK